MSQIVFYPKNQLFIRTQQMKQIKNKDESATNQVQSEFGQVVSNDFNCSEKKFEIKRYKNSHTVSDEFQDQKQKFLNSRTPRIQKKMNRKDREDLIQILYNYTFSDFEIFINQNLENQYIYGNKIFENFHINNLKIFYQMHSELSQSSVRTFGVRTRQQVSKMPRNIQKPKRKYSHISQECKSQLISLVYDKRLRIKDAAILCNLNYSTAKTILYNLRHKPQKQAVVRKLRENDQPTYTIKVLLQEQLIREYDFYQEIKSII